MSAFEAQGVASHKRILQFALDIISFFVDNIPNIIQAMTEESMSANAAREVWSNG